MELLGIQLKWECVEWGGIETSVSPFWDEKSRKNLSAPKTCKCGKAKSLRLIDFQRCAYTFVPKGAKLVDAKGNTIAEG